MKAHRGLLRTLAKAVLAGTIAVAGLGLGAVPASALTPNEKFVVKFYEDFLQRGPSNDEMTWWTTFLASENRASMTASLFDGAEFENLWVLGTRYYYLGDVEVEDASFGSDLSALASSGNFVASEVSVLASAPYFDLHDATNNGYVEGIYNDVLQRPSDPSGLSYWVGRLNTGTATRAAVATHFIRTNESANRRVGGATGATSCASTELVNEDALPAGSFCIVLDRMVDPSGYAYWGARMAGSGQYPDLWSSLASSDEYFTNAQL